MFYNCYAGHILLGIQLAWLWEHTFICMSWDYHFTIHWKCVSLDGSISYTVLLLSDWKLKLYIISWSDILFTKPRQYFHISGNTRLKLEVKELPLVKEIVCGIMQLFPMRSTLPLVVCQIIEIWSMLWHQWCFKMCLDFEFQC